MMCEMKTFKYNGKKEIHDSKFTNPITLEEVL